MSSKTKYEFYQEASLSQKLAHKIPLYAKLAGADPETSLQIAFLEVMQEFGFVEKEDPDTCMLMALLDKKRMALFATSEKVNEISKMGMQMPKAEDEFRRGGEEDDAADDDAEDEDP